MNSLRISGGLFSVLCRHIGAKSEPSLRRVLIYSQKYHVVSIDRTSMLCYNRY